MFLINWNTKFKILYLDFVFTSIWKTKFKYLSTIFMFNRFLLWIFNAIICFSFSYKMESEIQFIFRFSSSWRNWKKNYLKQSRLPLWLFSQLWSTCYTRASSCQVPWDFVITQTPRIRCLENNRCILMFMLLVPTFIFVLFFRRASSGGVKGVQTYVLFWYSLNCALKFLNHLKETL